MAMVRTYALHLFLVLPGLVAGLVLPVPSNIIMACPSYRCGHTVDIRYPFWVDDGGNGPHCGYRSLRLECRRDMPVLQLPSGEYGVTRILYGNKIDGDRTVSLVDLGIFSKANTCPLVTGCNLTLPSGSPPPLVLTDSNTNLTFFTNCSFEEIPSRSQLVECMEQGSDGRHHTYVFQDDEPRMPYAYARLCQDVVGMPVLRSSLQNGTGRLDDFVPALNKGFELRWLRSPVGEECHSCENSLSGGQLCGQRRGGRDEAWNFTCVMLSPASLADGSAPTFSFIWLMLFFYSFLLICL